MHYEHKIFYTCQHWRRFHQRKAAMLWKAHHAGEELNWIPLILIFIGLVLVSTAPTWMWSVIGV